MDGNGVFYCEEVISKMTYTDEELLIEVYVITIDPRMASTVLEKLSALLPLEAYGLSHLKRMRAAKCIPSQKVEKQLSIIICPVDKFDSIHTEIKDICEVKHVVSVCKVEPESKEEFSKWSIHWPMTFHPSQLEKDREKGFSSHEMNTMKQAVNHLTQDELNNHSMTNGVYCSGAVVVNPLNGRVVMTSNAALRHLSNRENDHNNNDKDHTPSNRSSSSSSSYSGNTIKNSVNYIGHAAPCPFSAHLSTLLSHPLYTPSMLCVEGVAAIVREEIDCEGALPDNFYLCSGLDLYVTAEPDLMSAMALVHSRIRRVYFKVADGAYGALLSGQGHIHSLKALNHHYRVFQVGHHCREKRDSVSSGGGNIEG